MVHPQLEEEHTVTLSEVKSIFQSIEKRDKELNYRSNKAKEFLDNFVSEMPKGNEKDLCKKLVDLNLTRLKEEHITSIINFLPTTIQDLRVVLQAYPLSLPKKDQERIVSTVKEFVQS